MTAIGGSHHFVVLTPIVDLPSDIVKAEEPLLVGAFSPEPGPEGLDETVVGPLAGTTETQDHIPAIGPEIGLPRSQLVALMPEITLGAVTNSINVQPVAVSDDFLLEPEASACVALRRNERGRGAIHQSNHIRLGDQRMFDKIEFGQEALDYILI